MKRILFAFAAVAAFASCNKEVDDIKIPESREIVISLEDSSLDIDVQTKTTAISSLPSSLYFAGTTGSGSSQTSKWASESKSVSSNKINTGYYQTATATSYNYYLSNCAMTFSASGCTISADGSSIDAIAGITKENSTTNPSVVLDHIFARTGTIGINSTNGYNLSNVTYTLSSKDANTGTKGTYNIYTGAWSSTTKITDQAITNNGDLYLIPGVYTLTVSGTEKLGDYQDSFTGSKDITLVGGKINNISVTRTGDGADEKAISVTVTLNPWGSNSINVGI